MDDVEEDVEAEEEEQEEREQEVNTTFSAVHTVRQKPLIVSQCNRSYVFVATQ